MKTDPAETMRKIKAEQRERLRDQFAMAALTGMMATLDDPTDVSRGDGVGIIARAAYRIVDAMMVARERTPDAAQTPPK